MNILLQREQVRLNKMNLVAAQHSLQDAYKEFAKQFRVRRQKEGISLRECAKRLELSVAYLSDIELGRRNPNEAVLNFFK